MSKQTFPLIYLCGPINGRSDADCVDWREHAKTVWPGETLDPMVRDYRDREHEEGIEREIVEGDKADIDRAKGLIVYFDQPSVGTAMEVLYAWQMGKPVVVVNASGKPLSPWLRYHCARSFFVEHSADTFRVLANALAHLSTLV